MLAGKKSGSRQKKSPPTKREAKAVVISNEYRSKAAVLAGKCPAVCENENSSLNQLAEFLIVGCLRMSR